MTIQITAETLSPITHNQIPVITTELLAQLYGTDSVRIRQNHNENKTRFIEGKHFFKVAGGELENLRVALNYSQNPISTKTRSLILWTARGAARHAKMLETDQAWEVFEKLEDCYFNQEERVEHVSPEITQAEKDAYNVKALINHYTVILDTWRDQIEPALRKIESPLAGRLHGRFSDGYIFLRYIETSLNQKLLPGQSPRIC